MDVLTLSRLQFGLTTVYHFFFVPLTIGLAFYVAILQSIWVKTGKEEYKKLTRFWGNLFLINFAVGVVTGLVMEFQFGMNWAEYSRFVGDVFGAPLAIEGLTAFFLESTFLGLWIFGWERLNKNLHLATIWLAAIGSVLSAMWILVANSFMQQPVGYEIVNGRAVMTDFWALTGNPQLMVQFPHTILSGLVTASFFILGISAYHLLRNKSVELFKKSFKLSLWIGVAVTFLIIVAGHLQTLHIFENQPMKMAAAEALWQTEDPASFSLLSIPDQANGKDLFAIRVPVLTSFMIYLKPSGEVLGINNLQSTYEQQFGPGNYIPPVAVAYFAFRLMVGAGFLMLGVTAYFFLMTILLKKDLKKIKFLALLPLAIVLPYLANSSGWILTEMGRQPWVVFGLLQTAQAYSPSVSTGEVLTSLITFIVIYSALIVVDITLLSKVCESRTAGSGQTDRDRRSGEGKMTLNTLWFILIAVLYTGYFILEGFDFGVGILLPIIGRNDRERRVIINTIGPHWDGNEVWLVVAGGATFAAFPLWYTALFSGFYLPLLIILAALILRGVAFEFRSKSPNPVWRKTWDWVIFAGSLVPAFLWGVAFVNFLVGVPIDSALYYTGGFWNLLIPAGAGWRAGHPLWFHLPGRVVPVTQDRGRTGRSCPCRVSADLVPGLARVDRPELHVVLHQGIGQLPMDHRCTSAILGLVLAAICGCLVARKHSGAAFVLTLVTFLLTSLAFFSSLYPNLMISSLDAANNLTITNAASGTYTLRVMSIVAAIFLPVVLAYQAWTYWVFRKRLSIHSKTLEY